jgi:hypothetical protein
MQIRVSTRDCRAAVGAAIVACQGRFEEDKARFSEASLKALREGAIHNGTLMTPALEAEMQEMVKRDLEHAITKHPLNDTLAVLNNFVDMLAYHRGDDVVIDDQDFDLLKKHLPTGDKNEEIAA